ncbi:unnamed protein product, partial [Closterium sp. NIES-53]
RLSGGRSSAGWRAGFHTALQCGRRSLESVAGAGVPAAQLRLDQLHLRRRRLRRLHPNRHRHRRLHFHRCHRSPQLCHHPHPHPLLHLHRHYRLPRHVL